jgi:predicted alpha/beta-hydrolase family hydrolase
MNHLLLDGPLSGRRVLILAHGAGAAMDTPFMEAIASGCSGPELTVARFEFPYMAQRRKDGRRTPPDRMPKLEQAFREVCDSLQEARTLFIGGKSLGGRVASRISDSVGAKGLICLGFPFHPPGKPDLTRVEPLLALQTPTLILQGTRDPFGRPEEVEGYGLPKSIHVHWMEGGDHSLQPLKRSGRTAPQFWAEAAEKIGEFLSTR